MRGIILLGSFLSALTTIAQNWALLNPAYRYNYSNDGTDTIRHQIRVMQVDTLGVDSFRYELNLIGVVCDTCPASLGGPCDGCFVRVNQPQFLGYDGVLTSAGWRFDGRDTFLLKPNAAPGAAWPFDPGGSVTAMVDAHWEGPLFGTQDSLRRIITTAGDTIEVSRSFGIARFVRGNQRLELIGVEGAGVGMLLPDPFSFFDYQSGDELTYRIVDTYTATPHGGSWFPQTQSYYWKFVIMGREDFPDSIRYAVSVARSAVSYGYPGGGAIAAFWRMPSNPWVIHRATLGQQHPILGAYPGQLLDRTAVWSSTAYAGYLAELATMDDGRRAARSAQLLPNNDGINLYNSPAPGLHPFYTGLDAIARVNVLYKEGLGLIDVSLLRQIIIQYRAQLVGAILNGDTIIPPPSINWIVGLDESEHPMLSIHPNPADDLIWMTTNQGDKTAEILDLEGRVVRRIQLHAGRNSIPAWHLAPGTYLVRMEGYRPQRLIIAR